MTPIQKLSAILPDKNTAFLITSDVNRRYLSLFPSSAGAVLVTAGESFLLVDFRYIEAARQKAADEVTVLEFKKLSESLNDIFQKRNIKSVVIEEEAVSVARFEELRSALSAEVLAGEKLSEKLFEIRCVKTDDEIALVEKAQRITEKAYLEVLNDVKPGVSERQIAVQLEHLIKTYGGERAAFDLITVTGAKTSMPHGVPSDDLIREGDFFLSDIGAVYEGYHSDMTRTVAVGYATDEMRAVYDIVLTAHQNASKKILSGSVASDVDRAARDYIASKGYGDYFGHSTGHGVGLEIHEPPAVSATGSYILRENNIITDEPGIYLPGKFGVRIEDMYVVKDENSYSLAAIPKDLIVI